MSVTRDFEERISWDDMNHSYFEYDTVIELLSHARALEAMLKKHEFPENGDCEECHEYRGRHSQDCQLAKLLEGVK